MTAGPAPARRADQLRAAGSFRAIEEQTRRRGVALDHNAKVTVMSSFDQGATTARDNLRKGEAAAQESLGHMQRGWPRQSTAFAISISK
jgi:hypothetical protein